jgi:hypothetical protein
MAYSLFEDAATLRHIASGVLAPDQLLARCGGLI